MNIFCIIAQKIINSPKIYNSIDILSTFFMIIHNNVNEIIQPDHFKVYNMIYDIFYLIKNKPSNYSFYAAKCKVLKSIINNMFVSEDYKNDYIFLFSKIQRHCNALNRFAYIYKFKKAPLQVTTDLLMNPINIENTNSIIIYQNDTRYLFVLNDLINIIETNISNAPDFFVNVLSPKNPYTNIVFNKSTLYNIYFKSKAKSNVISTLFHLYFLSNFDNFIYALENESYIRDFAIKKYVFNTPKCTLYSKIINMLKNHEYTHKLYFHPDFPKDLLVDIMRPFLYHKYITEFGVEGTEKIKIYKKILYYKLKKFYEYNKQFGRIFYKTVVGGRREISYNSNHIPFHLIDIGDVTNLPDTEYNFNFSSIIYVYSSPNEYNNEDAQQDMEEQEEEEEQEQEEPVNPYYYYFPSHPVSNNDNNLEYDEDSDSFS